MDNGCKTYQQATLEMVWLGTQCRSIDVIYAVVDQKIFFGGGGGGGGVPGGPKKFFLAPPPPPPQSQVLHPALTCTYLIVNVLRLSESTVT